MRLFVVGASHHLTPVEIRERLAVPKAQLVSNLQRLGRELPESESVLLSTCNRTEWYMAVPLDRQAAAEQWMLTYFVEKTGLEPEQLQPYLFQHIDRQAVEHLFRVAASLDSMVVGETQIHSQVREAYDLAAEVQPQLPVLHSVFQKAAQVAKTVAGETDIHRHRISVPSVAISGFASDIFETLADKQILVIGAGQIAEETLLYLREHGVSDINVVNRSRDRAEALSESCRGTAHSWESLHEQIQAADLVVATTGAAGTIMDLEPFQAIYQRRHQRPLLILDLAIPRDFDPRIGELPNVYLYSIDDLKAQCQRNLRLREKELPKAEAIVQQHVERFLQDWNLRFSIPTIQQLRHRTEEIKQEELARLMNKLGELSPEMQRELQIAFDRLVNKILHRPLTSLRDEAKSGQPQQLVDSLKRLFHLND